MSHNLTIINVGNRYVCKYSENIEHQNFVILSIHSHKHVAFMTQANFLHNIEKPLQNTKIKDNYIKINSKHPHRCENRSMGVLK